MVRIVNSSSQDCLNSKLSGVQYDFDKCMIALDSILAHESDTWLLDSGCFLHMTGDKDMFLSLMPFKGKGNKVEIISKGRTLIHGVHFLKDAYYVPGLSTSLFGIGQLCDDVVDKVCFSKIGCKVVGVNWEIMLTFPRSKEN